MILTRDFACASEIIKDASGRKPTSSAAFSSKEDSEIKEKLKIPRFQVEVAILEFQVLLVEENKDGFKHARLFCIEAT